MRKYLCALLALFFLLAGFGMATAAVLGFEDLPGGDTPVPNGYGGFNWNASTQVGSILGHVVGYGYAAGTIGDVSTYNWYGDTPTDITLAVPGSFTFYGAQFTSAFYDQDLTFQGLFNGKLLYSSAAYPISPASPLWIELDWSGINDLRIFNEAAGGGQWCMDNFTYDDSLPEPSTMLLICAGLAGIGICRMRTIWP